MSDTRQNFDAEIKHKRDLLLLKHAADFPKIIKFWEQTRRNFVQRGGHVEYKNAGRQNLFQHPATAHYREHSYEPFEIVQGPDITVELARFSVPDGASGIVRKLFQWVDGYSSSVSWGNPWVNDPRVDGLLWSLRLIPFKGSVDSRYISTDEFLPGQPYPDLPNFRYLWFLPNASQADINLVVPAGYSLRLYVRAPDPAELKFYVMGRLVGYWQSSEYPIETSMNVKKGF